MKIYTKTGDKGITSLIGGTRVLKSDVRIEAYGTVDELISHVGLIRDQETGEEVRNDLIHIQDKLMACASIIAADNTKKVKKLPVIDLQDINWVEKKIDELSAEVEPLKSFILPGGHTIVSYCHIARTVCRRAERNYIRVAETVEINELVLIFLNRLSDYFFVLARKLLHDLKSVEITWKPKLVNE